MGVISGGRVIEGSIPRDAVKTTIISGAAAGAHTVTGIKPRDTLVSVLRLDFADTGEVGVNDTAEYTIDATDTIDNTGGTSSAGGFLFVTWLSIA